MLASFKKLPATDSLDLNSSAEVRFLKEWDVHRWLKILIPFVLPYIL